MNDDRINRRRFESRVAVVTGGASGLGAATALRLGREGCRVIVLDTDLDGARRVGHELGDGVGMHADVSDPESIRVALEGVERVDVVINAAGHVAHSRLEKLDLETWNRMLAVHVTGTLLVVQATLELLRAANGGAVVNVASTAALVGRPHLTAYTAAKGAVVGLTRQLAVDLAPQGIRVNCVAPGDVRTPMTEPLYERLGGGSIEAGEALVASNGLLGRVAEPEEIAAVICFLASDEARFFTGSIVVPDGGVTAI